MQNENILTLEYYLSLGSNLGDRRAYLRKAVSFLETIGRVLKISSLYETEPVDMGPGTEDFYNQVVCFAAELSPLELLGRIKEFEKSMGRDITGSHKRSRKIDIDILLAGDLILHREELIIPHREMHKRSFVLEPLAEIAPGIIHPVLKKNAAELLSALTPGGGSPNP